MIYTFFYMKNIYKRVCRPILLNTKFNSQTNFTILFIDYNNIFVCAMLLHNFE